MAWRHPKLGQDEKTAKLGRGYSRWIQTSNAASLVFSFYFWFQALGRPSFLSIFTFKIKNKRKLGLGPGSSQSLQALRGLSLSLGNFGHRTSRGQGLPNSHILKKKEADAGCWLAAQQALGAANFFFLCKILGVRPSLRRQAGRPWNQDSAS